MIWRSGMTYCSQMGCSCRLGECLRAWDPHCSSQHPQHQSIPVPASPQLAKYRQEPPQPMLMRANLEFGSHALTATPALPANTDTSGLSRMLLEIPQTSKKS